MKCKHCKGHIKQKTLCSKCLEKVFDERNRWERTFTLFVKKTQEWLSKNNLTEKFEKEVMEMDFDISK